jgi:hypothetical protein
VPAEAQLDENIRLAGYQASPIDELTAAKMGYAAVPAAAKKVNKKSK